MSDGVRGGGVGRTPPASPIPNGRESSGMNGGKWLILLDMVYFVHFMLLQKEGLGYRISS